MKIPKVNHWSLELSDYNITFVHIKESNNIQADAVSRLKTLDIYRVPLGNPKTTAINDTEECIAEVVTNNLHTVSNDRLPTRQKDSTCRNLAGQSHHKNRNNFNPVMISADGLLQKQHYMHGFKHDVTIK